MTHGGNVPVWELASRTFVYHQDAVPYRRSGDGTQGMRATAHNAGDYIGQHVARQLDRALAAVAAVTVAAPPCGFVAGRPVNENLYELEGACMHYTCVGKEAALLLWAGVSSFWLCVGCGVPRKLQHFVAARYDELDGDLPLGSAWRTCAARFGLSMASPCRAHCSLWRWIA